MARRNAIRGMMELERLFEQLERVPQTVATQTARRGAVIARRAAKANAPDDTGQLKQGIIMKRERTRVKAKAVYDVMMDPAKNHIFVKTSKEGKRSYYPASQEYGYLTVDGTYIPGYRYFRRAIDDNDKAIESEMLETAGKAVDKILQKRR